MSDLFYVLLSAAVFGVDQYGKHQSRRKYSDGSLKVVRVGRRRSSQGSSEDGVPVIAVKNVQNEGAAMNLGAHHPLIIRAVSLILTAFLTIIFLMTLGKAGKKSLKTGLSLLLGGAFSNNYDRMRDRYVTDYVSFCFGPKKLQRIVFNIGDFAIIIGALLIALGDD